MKVPVRFIITLGVVLLFIVTWGYYKHSPQEYNTLIHSESAVHKVIQSNQREFGNSVSSSEISTSGSDYHKIVLNHEFPNCQKRNIYNGNANYILSDILKLARQFIPPPTDFVQHLKNPCWYANYDKVKSTLHWKTNTLQANRVFLSSLPNSGNANKLYCLPYMYLLGYPKCGTTSLFTYFKKHPEFATLSSRGCGWLGVHSSGLVHKYPADVRSVLNFVEHFFPASQQIAVSSTQDNMIIADFSPATSWRQEGFEQSGGSMCDPPLLLREMQPDAKFVVLLREPINRLYSAFWFYPDNTWKEKMKSLNAPKIFAEDVHTYFYRLQRCNKRKSMLECLREAGDFYHHFEMEKQLLTGFYYLYLLPWLQVFPRKSFLFIRAEDMKEDTGKILQEIFEFLQMSLLPKKQLDTIVKKIAHDQAMLHSNASNLLLSPSVKEQLRTYFRPFNEKLAELLGDDSFLWNDVS